MANSTGTAEPFGALLRRHRQAAALSQEALAERAGLSTDAVSVIERGRRGTPRPDTVALLARALGLEGEARAAFAAAARVQSPTQPPPTATSPAPGLVTGASFPAPRAPVPSLLEMAPLPMALTGLVGREREVAAVRARLLEPQTRLLTLTGPGGIGKTRLALEVARSVEGDFPDGVAFVALAALTDPELVPPTIARTLGLREQAGQPPLDLLRAALRDRRLLLVLDNCEQVVATAPRLAELLAAASGVRMLATSRARLAVAGERLYPVPPLRLPRPEQAADPATLGAAEAVRLFAERARDALPDFAVDAGNAVAVGAICARLDGLPLAIELAAARVRHLPPGALLVRLEGSLALLTGGPRDAPERQQTLQATIAWSYTLLEGEGKALFRRLSVFVGGWTLEAAEAVCRKPAGLPALGQDLLLGLAALADQSLVAVESDREGEPRYRLLETVREFGRERLLEAGELELLASAHAAYFLALAEQAEPALMGPEHWLWRARLAREQDNLRAARHWFLERGAADEGLRLAIAHGKVSPVEYAFSEAVRDLEQALARPDAAPDRARAWALVLFGWGTMTFGNTSSGRRVLEEGLLLGTRLEERPIMARALLGLGVLATFQGDYPRARALLEESLALYRQLSDWWGLTKTLGDLARVVNLEGDRARARTLLDEALALAIGAGEHQMVAFALEVRGEVAFAVGEYASARGLWEESLNRYKQLGITMGMVTLENFLGLLALRLGDYATARARYQSSLGHQRGWLVWAIQSFAGLAAVASAGGQAERALRLAGAASAQSETAARRLLDLEQELLRTAITVARAALDEGAAAAAWAAGQAMTLEEAIAEARGAES